METNNMISSTQTDNSGQHSVPSLKSLCEKVASERLVEPRNAIQPLEIADSLGADDLKKYCEGSQEIQSSTQASLESQSDQPNNHMIDAPVAESGSVRMDTKLMCALISVVNCRLEREENYQEKVLEELEIKTSGNNITKKKQK